METKHKKFKPYDRVLVRDSEDKWQIDFYSHWSGGLSQHVTLAFGDGLKIDDKDILPFEGNEHLVGTTDEPEEEIKLEEGEWIIANDRDYPLEIGHGSLGKCIRVEGNTFVERSPFGDNGLKYFYAIRLKDFNPNDIEETKKHILCVKNGKVVKYKG